MPWRSCSDTQGYSMECKQYSEGIGSGDILLGYDGSLKKSLLVVVPMFIDEIEDGYFIRKLLLCPQK